MSSRSLRQEYLERSANYLTWSSPSTSRALQLEQLSFRRISPAERLNKHDLTCLACGNNEISLQTAWPDGNIPSRKKRPQKSTGNTRRSFRMIVRKCETCGRASRHLIPGPVKQKDQPQPDASIVSPPEDIPAPEPALAESKSTTASGKRRAKARKEGLQALLSKSKQVAKPSPAFNLMDFMRTS